MQPSVRYFLLAAMVLCTLAAELSVAQVPSASRERVILVDEGSTFTPADFKSPKPTVEPVPVVCRKVDCDPIEIKVWVDPLGNDSSGRTCAFTFPVVVILKKKNAKVTWKLTEIGSTQNARFSDKPGAEDGIRIYQSNPRFKNRARQDVNFGWERDDDTSDGARVLFYDINVDHDLGGKKCDVPDPIIVNRD